MTIMKAAVVRACLYDPDVNVIYAAFARHWGFTPLPTRPRNPQENGKQERSGGYVKDNALKGRRFNSLAEQNEHLRRWNRTVARLRIHGTTRRQVFAHFLEVEKPALQPLAAEPFAFFRSGQRTIHPDGHVEVDGAFYPAPLHLLGQKIRVRWDRNLVRLYHDETQVAVYTRLRPGQFAPRPGESGVRNLLAEGFHRPAARPLRARRNAAARVGGSRSRRTRRPRSASDPGSARFDSSASPRTCAGCRPDGHCPPIVPLQRLAAANRTTRRQIAGPTSPFRTSQHSSLNRLSSGGFPMNPQLLSQLRHLRLSGMAEALPASP